jgi:hypothetical protein
VRRVFACEERDGTIGSMDVFLYSQNPKGWDMSAYTVVFKEWKFSVTYLFGLSALATIRLLLLHRRDQLGDPTMLPLT